MFPEQITSRSVKVSRLSLFYFRNENVISIPITPEIHSYFNSEQDFCFAGLKVLLLFIFRVMLN
jgi:hypothetical protein